MDAIIINQSIDLLIPIPQSSSGDTVTYEIFNSAGTVLQSGSMTFVRDEIWKIAFTPTALGTITLKVNDTTITSKRESFFQVVSQVTAGGIPVSDTTDDTDAELLVKVKAAIVARMNGGAVQSYTVAGRDIQYCTLKELLELRDYLERKIDSASSTTGGRTYATF